MDEGRTFPLPATQSLAWQDQVQPVCAGYAEAARPNFLTIVTADRAAQSRIFARSARDCHPDARLVVVVAGAAVPPRIFEDLYDEVIAVEQLSLGGLADMQFRYSIAEQCFALKPWVIRHLLDRFGDAPTYYFDSDIELFTPLAEVEAALAHGANLVLTPHILEPGLDPDRERALLQSGSFNAGFLAIAPSAPARAFVAWWCERVRTGCTHDPLQGTYGDQKWLELAPAICDGVTVLRHPGYNFAYWNAQERQLSCLGGVWTTAGRPLRFVHYSRWNLQEQDAEQYLAGFFSRAYQPFACLFSEYQQKVRDEGRLCDSHAHYTPDQPRSPSGEPLPELIRHAYARHGSAVDGDGSAVFAHVVAILAAPSAARANLPGLPITVLYDEIWQHHGDLRYRFDIDRENGRLAYLRWLVDGGAAELGIPAQFLPPARSALERERVRQLEGAPEAADETTDPGVSVPPAPPETVAALLAARDTEREQSRLQRNDIRLLVSSNKGLRREVRTLRVRSWRDEEKIQALEQELSETRYERATAIARSHQLADEIALLRARSWQRLVDRLSGDTCSLPTGIGRRPILAGEGPFFRQGFQLSDATVVAGTAVRRLKGAPAGTFIYGPYAELSAGAYAATVSARLYRRLPVVADFKVDVVRDSARQVIAVRHVRLYSPLSWRRFELVFNVLDGEEAPDFEIRMWASEGMPIEIGAIGLDQLSVAPPPAAATP
jgi:hypothetical protein